MTEQELRERLREAIEREQDRMRDIRDMDTPAWGMCSGAIEAYQQVLAWLDGWIS